jgi:hypothetical protein
MMPENKKGFLKALVMSYGIVGVFTAISIIGPILLGRNRDMRTRRK